MAWYNSFFSNRNNRIESDKFSLESIVVGITEDSFYPETVDFDLLKQRSFILSYVILKLSNKFSQANFTAKDLKKVNLLNKLKNPNSFQSQQEFIKEAYAYCLSFGMAVIWKKYDSFGVFNSLQLINLNPFLVSIDGEKVSFEYEKIKYDLLKKDLIFLYDNNFDLKTKKGLSRIIPLKSQVTNIDLVQKAKNIQISKSGLTIVSPKQVGSGNAMDDGLDKPVIETGSKIITQKSQIEDNLNSRGLSNRIIVSTKGLDAVNLAEKLATIDFHKIVESDLMLVCDTFGWPIELTPFGGSSKFNNKAVAELSVVENELIPFANNFVNTLNSEFKEQGEIKVDFNHLDCMSIIAERIQKTNKNTVEQLKLLLDSNVITAIYFKKVLIEKNILNE